MYVLLGKKRKELQYTSSHNTAIDHYRENIYYDASGIYDLYYQMN